MKVYKITQNEVSFFVKDISLDDIFSGAEIGEKVTIELQEMTEEEYESLPEFDGF